MAITVAAFKAAFPEFSDAPDNLVSQQLTYAQDHTPSSIWGDRAEEGAFLWCAKLLALSPYSRKMGIVDPKDMGTTIYDKRLHDLIHTVAPRFLVF